MWSRGSFTKKVFTVVMIYFFLLLLRKTILSFDVTILQWLLRDIKFPHYQGQVKGFLNLGELNYNLTQNKLSGVTIQHSNIDTSNMWKHTGKRYLNITLENGNGKFHANWAYSAWPSLADHGSLSLDLHNVSLQFGVEINANKQGLIHVTTSKCLVRIMSVDLEFYHEPNMMYDSIKASLQKKAKDSLPGGLCKALHQGLLKHVSSVIQNVQHKFLNFTCILSGDVKSYHNLTSTLGWIVVYAFVTAVKVVHDYGVTLLVVLTLLSLYLVYEVFRSTAIIAMLNSSLSKNRNTKLRTLSDPEPYPEQEKPVLTQVYVTMVSRSSDVTTAQPKKTFMSSLKRLLWWRKPKEN